MNAFPPGWLFHYRWVKQAKGCKDAEGRTITFVQSGGRTSAVVAAIQKKQGRSRQAKEKGNEEKPAKKAKPAKKEVAAKKEKPAKKEKAAPKEGKILAKRRSARAKQ